MKKLLVVLLAFVMAFAFTACGEQKDTAAPEEGLTAIPLGGSLGDYAIDEEVFGTYVQVDFPEGAEPGENVDAQLYYSEGSVTPYIAVYRWSNEDGKTLEQEMADYAEGYGFDYTISNWGVCGTDENGYYTAGYTYNDNYYYLAGIIVQDGDDFVEIDFLAATEEIQLGDTGQYIWVPTGSIDLMDEDEVEHGTLFWGEYAESKYLPTIGVGPYVGSYDELEWYWSDVYPDGLPFDEATYEGWWAEAEKDGWTDELNKKYYAGLGAEFDKHKCIELEDGNSIGCYYYTFNDIECTDLYFNIGDECYDVILIDNGAHLYSNVVTNSLHTK